MLEKREDGKWTAQQYRVYLRANAAPSERTAGLAGHNTMVGVQTEPVDGRLVDVPDGV